MEPDPPNDAERGISLWDWLLMLAAALLLATVWALCYFIVPKIEASWAMRGQRLPGWAMVLIESSHFAIKYWWGILLAIAGAAWFLASRTNARKRL